VADIVGVHGIWCDQDTGPGTQHTWTEWLRIGLTENHHPDPNSVTVRVAYYGHLYNDGKGVATTEVGESVELDEFEQEILTAMSAEAGVTAETAGAKLGLPAGVQALLLGLVNTPWFGNVTTSGVLWLVRQLRRYFTDAEFRASVYREIEIAMAEDTQVVVGHSLGSVAAFEALRAHPEWPAHTLITLGSPLGLPGVMRRLSPPLGSDDRWPGSVRTWVNVSAKQDPVALVKRLRHVYDGRIGDRIVRNTLFGGHDATQYLRNVHTAKALIDALR
jgi:hypothetical protein